MPIRDSEKARYPVDWPVISKRIRERAGDRCEFCDVPNGALGGRTHDGTFWHAIGGAPGGPEPGSVAWCIPPDSLRGDYLRIIRIVLTVAHLDHTPENCADDNLKALCQRCHLNYDKEHHHQTRRAARADGDLFDQQ